MRAVIELDHLQVDLGRRTILKSLTGSLNGRAIGLLGPNGAGKSTLINALLGFHPPTSGTARIFGRDIRTDILSLRRMIGYMPENDSFIADMSGVRFVRYMAELSGLPPDAALERAHEAFFYVGLGEARYRKVGGYSLGMKQLAKLAQAIAHGPKLLFLDEPTNGLDPPARARMLQLIREIRDAEEMHIVLSSHLLRDVEECCDEVIILKDGQIAGISNLEEERRTNRKFLELETAGETRAFAEAFEKLGCDCAVFNNGKMRIILPDGIEIRELYAIAADQNVQIRRMNYRKDSLEDIFLKAMEPVGGQSNGRI
jgi:ABC-2 type transport system ATP-binding protein